MTGGAAEQLLRRPHWHMDDCVTHRWHGWTDSWLAPIVLPALFGKNFSVVSRCWHCRPLSIGVLTCLDHSTTEEPALRTWHGSWSPDGISKFFGGKLYSPHPPLWPSCRCLINFLHLCVHELWYRLILMNVLFIKPDWKSLQKTFPDLTRKRCQMDQQR